MDKFFLYFSFVSTLMFWSASVIFLFLYNSISGGLWAATAGCLAGLYFYLSKLYFSNKLQDRLTTRKLDYLASFCFIICLVSSAFLLWYMFAMVYWKILPTDLKQPLIFPCVFSFISCKWGYLVYSAAKKLRIEFLRDYSPIVQNIYV